MKFQTSLYARKSVGEVGKVQKVGEIKQQMKDPLWEGEQ